MTTPGHVDRRVGIIGLGYVGLPIAIAFVESGLEVVGIDSDAARVASLAAGISPIGDISDERLGTALGRGFHVVVPGATRIGDLDAVFVCVPTPIGRAKDPDLGYILSAASLIREGLRPGQLIVLQSTTFPGTTNGPFRAALEVGGLTAGSDFDLAYAPERVNPGDPASSASSVPRLVGGSTSQATDRAAVLLERISDDVVRLTSPDAAELAKLLENVFRSVNIALANDLKVAFPRRASR